jgi:hypothetical protein
LRRTGLAQLAGPVGEANRVSPSDEAVSFPTMRRPELSPGFEETAARERELLLGRYAECKERAEHHQELAAEATREAERYAKTIRELGELLGIEDQLSLSDLSDQLRGERLREVAADVLWRNFHAGDVVHYKQWLERVVAEGYRIGGKNPTATFLTQVARVESVERMGRRSGLYRLSTAAQQ